MVQRHEASGARRGRTICSSKRIVTARANQHSMAFLSYLGVRVNNKLEALACSCHCQGRRYYLVMVINVKARAGYDTI